MKAEKIRAARASVKDLGRLQSPGGKDTVEHITCWVLHEIAAQLAELNEKLADVTCKPPTYSDKLSAVRVQQY